MKKYLTLIVALLIVAALSNVAFAQSCGFTCDGSTCNGVPTPVGCSPSCNPGDTGCTVCTGTNCPLGCVQEDPNLVFSEACSDAFDWENGDLTTIPPDLLVENLDKIGARFSELSAEQKQAVAEKIIDENPNIPQDSLDFGGCADPNFCNLQQNADGTLTLFSGAVPSSVSEQVSLTFDQSTIIPDGAQFQATDNGWLFIPPAVDIVSEPQNIVIDGISYGSNVGGGQILFTADASGNKIAILDEKTYIISEDTDKNTETVVYCRDSNQCTVYLDSNVPAGETGISINSPETNGNGVNIVGTDAVIAHTSNDETIGIITDQMADDEKVTLSGAGSTSIDNVDKQKFDLDLTEAGNANVKYTNGIQGNTYDAGDMYACNQASASCPNDEQTDIVLDVAWCQNGDGATCDEANIIVQGQVGILGQDEDKVLECNCDHTKLCDPGCVCDMICGLEELPQWLWITLGYEEYLQCIGGFDAETGGAGFPDTVIPKGDLGVTCDSNAVGYASGEVAADDTFCCQEYGDPSRDELAFKDRNDQCQRQGYDDICGIRQSCPAFGQDKCVDTRCNRAECESWCWQRCGYCNKPINSTAVDLYVNISTPIPEFSFIQFIKDDYPETVRYSITQEDPSQIECTVIGDLCELKDGLDQQIQLISCTTPEAEENASFTIKLRDECGDKRDGILTIRVIDAQTQEQAAMLGFGEFLPHDRCTARVTY